MPIIATTSGYTPLDDLVSETAAYAPECPRPLLTEAVRRTLRKFFSDSRCWRDRNLTLFTTVAGQTDYVFNPPANAELLDVLAAWEGDKERDQSIPGEEDDFYPGETNQDWTIGTSADGLNVVLTPAPDATGKLIKGVVAYTLSENATGLPSWVYREYRDALAMGAAAGLIIQPKKPWTEPALYQPYKAEFDNALCDASNKAGPIRRKPLRTHPW